MAENKLIRMYPRYLWFLILSYVMVIVLSNWFNPRFIQIFGIDTDAGTLIFPFTFILADMITEVYGFKQARRAIICGLIFNCVFYIYGQAVMSMPSPDYETNNDMFDAVHAVTTRIIVASTISYLIAEFLNVFILAKMKKNMRGKFMGIRFVSSTFIAAGLDSVIFGVLAFYGLMSNENLISLILGMWFLKVMIEIIGLSISIRIANKLKEIEQLDIYDTQTDFGIMRFEAEYSDKDNKFDKDDESKK